MSWSASAVMRPPASGPSRQSRSAVPCQRWWSSVSIAPDVDRRPVVWADRRGPLDHEQAVDEARHPVELTGHDLVRLGNVDRLGAAGAAQQIHVPTRDRDRRQELVRGVRDEHALAVEIGRPLGGERLRDRGRLLPPADVEDHRREHERHERDLGQLRHGLPPHAVAHNVRTPVDTMTNAIPISVPRSRQARKP